MKWILGREGRVALEAFAASSCLVAFDYDGTLAPICRDPTRAHMREPTRRLLEQLTCAYPVIVITGRQRQDALRFLEGTGVHAVAGNHGQEWGEVAEDEDPIVRIVRSWHLSLTEELARVPGVHIEVKSFSLSIHYRASKERTRAARAVHRAAERLTECRIVAGKAVYNVVPARAAHKGTALSRALRAFHCEKALFVGDDVTDEDAFALARYGSALGVRVRRHSASRAPYFVRTQREVDALLATLLHYRAR